MPMRTAFGSGWLFRPLLDISNAEIGASADELDLDWLDDPSNPRKRPDGFGGFNTIFEIPDQAEPEPASISNTSTVIRDER